MTVSVEQRVAELREQLRLHDRLYYVDAAPKISDTEYDRLMNELKQFESERPELITPDSPTQRVGGEPLAKFNTVPHALPMYSIDNTYKPEDLRKWAARCFESIDETVISFDIRLDAIRDEEERLKGKRDEESTERRESLNRKRKHIQSERQRYCEEADANGYPVAGGYVAEPKIDGVALSLRYENGLLVQALTRGDGRRGDDITKNAFEIRTIPRGLRSDQKETVPEILEVRGEVVMPDVEFQRINSELTESGEDRLVNPRNATAGTLKQLDPKAARRRHLAFVAHGRGEVGGRNFDTYEAFVKQLKDWRIPTSTKLLVCKSIDEVWAMIEEFDSQRQELPYGTDGVVVRLNRHASQEALGYTSKSPRWCIAYKYAAEQATTKLIAVDWQVGKTGKLTPRATMEPVFVAGTTVQHATLHNLGEIRRKDIHYGDTVVIEKAGEIIPQVVRVVPNARTPNCAPIRAPNACPECRGPVESEFDKTGKETARYCLNPECPAQLRERLIHFVGRRQMDISGIGEEVIDQLLKRNLVSHFADLYHLSKEQLADLTHIAVLESKETEVRLGESNAERILRSLVESKQRGLARLLGSLGIHHIGTQTARVIASHVDNIDELLDGDEVFIRGTVAENRSTSKLERAMKVARQFHDALHSADGAERVKRAKESAIQQPAANDVRLFLDDLPDGGSVWGVKWGKGGGKKDRLYDHFGSLDELCDASIQDLTSLFDDEIVGKSLYDFLRSPEGSDTINRLRSVDVEMTSQRDERMDADSPLAGLTVVVTGTLAQYSRDRANDLIRRLGGKPSSSVSRNTNILLAGENAGSKLQKAEQLGIRIINEVDFTAMIVEST